MDKARRVKGEKKTQREGSDSRLAILLRQARESAGFCGWELDLEEDQLHWHELCDAPFRVPSSKAMGGRASLLALCASKSVELLRGALKRAEREREGWNLDLEFIDAEGESFYVRSLSDVMVHEGSPCSIVGSFVDITDQRRSEEAAKAGEEQLRVAFDHSLIPMAMLSPSGRYLRANPAMSELVGYTEEELIQRDYQSLTHPEDLEASLGAARQLLEELAPPYLTEKRYIHKDGSIVWVMLSAMLVPSLYGKPPHLISVMQDITQRKRAEADRARSEQTLMATTDLVLTSDRMGNCLFMNPAGRKLLGLNPGAEIQGLPMAAFHTEQGAAVLVEESLPQAEQSGSWTGETELIDQQGTAIPASQVLLAHRNLAGRIVFYSTIIRDLRPFRDLEERLLHSQKLDSIGRLAGGVAHDFNNLLTVILGHLEILEGQEGDPDEVGAGLTVIGKAAGRAADLTSRLLAFARRQVIKPEIADLNTLLLNFDKLLRRVLGEDIELVTWPTEDLWLTQIDRGQFEQIVLNLSVNARDAMPDGGKLTLRTENVTVPAGTNRFGPEGRPGDFVCLSFTDTGVGMDEELKRQVFEPFFTTKDRGHGTGLGLATSHGAVRQNGGYITLESEPGVGSVFRIYLPRVDRELPEQDPVHTRREQGGTETVLVVEDEVEVLQLTATALKSKGYTVLKARTGPEAVRIATHHDGPIDLLFADVVLPKLGGPQVAERVREQYPNARVLFASGYSEGAIGAPPVAEAEVDFLPKPYTPGQLLDRVRELLDR